jgi:hypothetical protein
LPDDDESQCLPAMYLWPHPLRHRERQRTHMLHRLAQTLPYYHLLIDLATAHSLAPDVCSVISQYCGISQNCTLFRARSLVGNSTDATHFFFFGSWIRPIGHRVRIQECAPRFFFCLAARTLLCRTCGRYVLYYQRCARTRRRVISVAVPSPLP